MKPAKVSPRKLLLAQSQPDGVVAHAPATDGLIRSHQSARRRKRALAVAPEQAEPLGPFIEACGGQRTLTLSATRRDLPTVPQSATFQQPFVVIGRSRDCDLALPHSTVGFRHVYLQLIDGRWFFVNLARLSRVASATHESSCGWFDPGQVLSIGPYLVQNAAIGAPAVREPAKSSASGESSAPLYLELVNGRTEPQGPRLRPITSTVTLIGASRQCEIWLRDSSVSKVHASLVQTPHGLWLVDLLGRDGVLVDDRPVYWKQLRAGQDLQVGRFRFRIQVEAGRTTGHLSRPAGMELAALGASSAALAAPTGAMPDAVYSVVQQLSQMQAQFFEHSQMQMQLMAEMLSQLRSTQQSSIRQDLARIDEISRELQAIRRQLDSQSANAEAPEPSVDSPAAAQSVAAHDDWEPRSESMEGAGVIRIADVEESLRAPGRADKREADSKSPAAAEPASGPASAGDPRTRLTRRMAKLAEERSTRWSRVLQAFQRGSSVEKSG